MAPRVGHHDASGRELHVAAQVVIASVGATLAIERVDLAWELVAREREDGLVDDDHRGLGIRTAGGDPSP
jgi:hypothetical protein